MAEITTEDFPAALVGDVEQRAQDIETIISQANAAELLDEEDLQKISQKVLKEFEIDENSTKEWRKKTEKAMNLAKQVAGEKTTPWRGAANVKYPLITVAAMQFAARAYPIIVNNQRVARGVVIGSDEGIPLIENGQPVADQEGNPVFAVPPGAKRERANRVAQHISYQLLEEMEEWEEETDYKLHALPIVGCMFRKTFYDPELERNKSKVLWPDELIVNNDAKSLKTAPRITQCIKLHPYQVEERKRAGLWRDIDLKFQDTEDEEALEEFLEQHTRLDLDGDGYPEPYVVTVHKESQEVVRIAPNFDSRSIRMAGNRIRKIEPFRFYTKYQFLPDPDGGFYGVGFGQLLFPINESVNTVINQLLDAGTLQNRGGGFIGKGIRLRKGEHKFKIGEWKTVDVGPGSIRDNVFPIPAPEPSNVLFSLLGLLIQAGRDISSVQDVNMGRQDKVTQPTTTLALIDQGEKVYTGIIKRVHRALKNELSVLYDLNRRFLTDQEYFQVLDTPMAVARSDYADDIAIVPISDPSMASDLVRQKRAELLMSQLGNPFINGLEVTKRFLEAIGVESPESLLVIPQPDPEVLRDIARLENDRIRAEATVMETRAKAVELLTGSVKNLADAKDRNNDKEINGLIANIGAFVNFIGALDVRAQGVAGAPDNGAIPQGAGREGQGN